MNQSATITKKKNLKKKRLIVLFAALAVLLLLIFLNTLDFESSPTEQAPPAPYAPETYPIFDFCEPDYESNIFDNPEYKVLDHSIHYTFNNQSVSLNNTLKTLDHESYDPDFDAFFVNYFTALAKGVKTSADTMAFNAFYSDVYFRNHTSFTRFAPQKVYDIDIVRRTNEQIITSEEKEEDAIYVGSTLTSFEVRYKIYQNDGTFRRDIISDDVIVQYIDLLRHDGKLTINAIGYARHSAAPADDSLLPLILPLVWLVLAIVCIVLFIIIKKLPYALCAACLFVTFLVSMSGPLLWQFVVFGILGVATTLFLLLRHRKAKKQPTE